MDHYPRRHFIHRAAILTALPFLRRTVKAATTPAELSSSLKSKQTFDPNPRMTTTGSNSSVIVVNPFEVPVDREAEALHHWDRVDAFMKRQPGFISARLLQAYDSNARFRLVTLAEWASMQDFLAALGSPELGELARGLADFPHYPGAYQVIRPMSGEK